ncbi:hypothetical protein [Pseudomonas gessardii]|uniref:hypothetical protein n=1 Tax=Pseudomonas gessardii TaxID=78544 RepID=UPI0021CCA001|nr:hypothetical protein [Pseudomonas gessardii]
MPAARVILGQAVARQEPAVSEPAGDAATVKTLFSELLEAERGSKAQVARDLRDKLNDLRQKLGDEKFKEILESLKRGAAEDWLALMKRLFPDLFPDEPSQPPSAPRSPGGRGGGGGGGGGANPATLGPRESMSNRPLTKGAQYHDYKLDKSNPGKKPSMGREQGNIWSGFSQSQGTGNCITIAAIKAAMMKFGQEPTDVFRDVRAAGDGFDIQMRDGFQLHLSKDELRTAAEVARFEGDDPALMTSANVMFAASGKRAHMEGNRAASPQENDENARRSYRDALESLMDGEGDHEGLDRLGLKGLYRQSSHHELASGGLGIINYSQHSMAVIGGQVELNGGRGGPPQQEEYGQAYIFI